MVIVINDQRIDPMPVVIGAAKYPENIIEDLGKVTYISWMLQKCKETRNSRAFNVIVLSSSLQQG